MGNETSELFLNNRTSFEEYIQTKRMIQLTTLEVKINLCIFFIIINGFHDNFK